MIVEMNITPISIALTVIGSLLLFGFLLLVWYIHNIWTDFRSMALTRIRTKLDLSTEWTAVRKWQTWENITVIYKHKDGHKKKVNYRLKGGKEIIDIEEIINAEKN